MQVDSLASNPGSVALAFLEARHACLPPCLRPPLGSVKLAPSAPASAWDSHKPLCSLHLLCPVAEGRCASRASLSVGTFSLLACSRTALRSRS